MVKKSFYSAVLCFCAVLLLAALVIADDHPVVTDPPGVNPELTCVRDCGCNEEAQWSNGCLEKAGLDEKEKVECREPKECGCFCEKGTRRWIFNICFPYLTHSYWDGHGGQVNQVLKN